MTEQMDPASVGTHGLSRRTVVKAGAWSVPVIAAAVAAPLASASTVGFDLAAEPLNRGDGFSLFTADLTQSFSVGSPLGFIIGNRGTQPSPAEAISVQLRVDSRVWDVTGMTYAFAGDAPTPVASTAPTISGDAATYTWTFVSSIPVGSDFTTGLTILFDLDMIAQYPNDHLDDYVPPIYTVIPPSGDSDASNNLQAFGAPTYVPAEPFGALLDINWEGIAVAAQYTAYRPTSATLTSVGPNPLLVGEGMLLRVDDHLTDTIGIQGDATLNGVAVPGLIEARPFTDPAQSGLTFFAFTRELAAGDVLGVTFAYTQPTTTAVPDIGSARAQLTYWPEGRLNDPDQRRTTQLDDITRDATPL